MRKILLATTALMAFAGAAQAAESPIQVTLGGSVDFRAALFNESQKDDASIAERRTSDFQTQYELTVAAEGKAANGIEYGAVVNLDNDIGRNATTAVMDYAYVWMSGAFGKVILGDERGPSNLMVFAPTVGAGQIDGYYMDFTSADVLVDMEPTYVNPAEDQTKVTYFTPKVGNENHKVQLGVSYSPSTGSGTTVTTYDDDAGYKNTIEVAAQYKGTFDPVSVVVTPMLITAESEAANATLRDYTLWGIGAQAMYAGFTFGGSYVDAGRLGTGTGQNRDQHVWTIGLKYGFDKVELAANYLSGEGYYDTMTAPDVYVDSYEAVGLGATYVWFPGLRTAADAVFYNQNRADTGRNNRGHVMMLSQKMSF